MVLSPAGLEPKCLNTKRKAACVATSGPNLGRKRPSRAAIVGWGGGRYRIPLAKTIALNGSIERRDHGPIRRFMALALKASTSARGQIQTSASYQAKSGH